MTVREIQVNDVRSGDGTAVLLDVRSPAGFAAGHVVAARLPAAAGARVRSLTVGTEAWRQAGHPVETGR